MKFFLVALFSSFLTLSLVVLLFFNNNSFSVGGSVMFSTKNEEFKFKCNPTKGRDHNMMIRSFNKFKARKKLSNDMKIYRVTPKNYFRINSWCEYKFAPEWSHEYLWFWKKV